MGESSKFIIFQFWLYHENELIRYIEQRKVKKYDQQTTIAVIKVYDLWEGNEWNQALKSKDKQQKRQIKNIRIVKYWIGTRSWF